MTSLSSTKKSVATGLSTAMMERAARISAMLDRWNADDVSEEPEWSVEELEPMSLRASVDTEPHQP
jgi:hypothetical protein